MVLLCGASLLCNIGCGDKIIPKPTPAEQAAGLDQQIQKVQSNPDMSEAQKAGIIAMLKSHAAPPPPVASNN